MSERTVERRFARERAWEIWDFKRVSSVRCWVRISRWRAKLVVLRAEGGEGSLSRVRARVVRRVVRWEGSVREGRFDWGFEGVAVLFRGSRSIGLQYAVLRGLVGVRGPFWRHIERRCGRGIPSGGISLVGFHVELKENGDYFGLCGSCFSSLLSPAGCTGCHGGRRENGRSWLEDVLFSQLPTTFLPTVMIHHMRNKGETSTFTPNADVRLCCDRQAARHPCIDDSQSNSSIAFTVLALSAPPHRICPSNYTTFPRRRPSFTLLSHRLN